MAGHKPKQKDDFAVLLADVKGRIQSSQARAFLAVNAELVRLYWDIGRIIDQRQKREGWGTAVIPRLSNELKNELPELKGFSERNIKRMLAFFRCYPDPIPKVPEPLAQLPDSLHWLVSWAHHVILMDKMPDLSIRCWYIEQSITHGWSSNFLSLQINAQAHARHGKASSNFAAGPVRTGATTAQRPSPF